MRSSVCGRSVEKMGKDILEEADACKCLPMLNLLKTWSPLTKNAGLVFFSQLIKLRCEIGVSKPTLSTKPAL